MPFRIYLNFGNPPVPNESALYPFIENPVEATGFSLNIQLPIRP